MRPLQSVIRWGEILKRTGRASYEDDCLVCAGELAFFWFLALFPALLFIGGPCQLPPGAAPD